MCYSWGGKVLKETKSNKQRVLGMGRIYRHGSGLEGRDSTHTCLVFLGDLDAGGCSRCVVSGVLADNIWRCSGGSGVAMRTGGADGCMPCSSRRTARGAVCTVCTIPPVCTPTGTAQWIPSSGIQSQFFKNSRTIALPLLLGTFLQTAVI